MAITKDEVVEFIANMSVLDLSEFIKELEENINIISPRHQHLFLELLKFMGK